MIEGIDSLSIPRSGTRLSAYEAAANEGRLFVAKMSGVRRIHWFPRLLWPFCLSDEIRWIEAEGRGVVYSF